MERCRRACSLALIVFNSMWPYGPQPAMGFSRQECWSQLPCPPPEESSRPRDRNCISCGSWIASRFLTAEPPQKPHNGMLLSHKKEWIWGCCSQVDEPRTSTSAWSKSEREKQIYIERIYMGSRKMVLMNLVSGKQWRCRWRGWTYYPSFKNIYIIYLILAASDLSFGVRASLWLRLPGSVA